MYITWMITSFSIIFYILRNFGLVNIPWFFKRVNSISCVVKTQQVVLETNSLFKKQFLSNNKKHITFITHEFHNSIYVCANIAPKSIVQLPRQRLFPFWRSNKQLYLSHYKPQYQKPNPIHSLLFSLMQSGFHLQLNF